jgi:hypothetical protein
MRQDASMATMNGLSQEYRGAADARSLLQIVLECYGPRDSGIFRRRNKGWPSHPARHRDTTSAIRRCDAEAGCWASLTAAGVEYL